MSVLSDVQSWFLSTVQSRRLLGRRLVINFPTSLDKRVGIVELPLGSSHLFVIKEIPDGQPGARLVLVSDAREVELGVFASKADAETALGSVRRSFTRPLRKAVKWLIVIMLWAMMVEWATTPSPPRAQAAGAGMSRGGAPASYGAPGASLPAPALTPATQAVAADLLKQLQIQGAPGAQAPGAAPEKAPSEPVGEVAAASTPMPGGTAPEAAAALKLLRGK